MRVIFAIKLALGMHRWLKKSKGISPNVTFEGESDVCIVLMPF
jgi:hypothetical protein